MAPLLGGIIAVGLIWWLLKSYVNANPTVLSRYLRQGGGVVALAIALLLALRGRFDVAIAVGGFGAMLLGLKGLLPAFLQDKAEPSNGHVSTVRSALLEMRLDHDSGSLSGTVIGGRLAGQDLDRLDRDALDALIAECAVSDPDGLRLMEPYMDRRFPGWREHAQAHGHAGGNGNRASSNQMTEKEAYDVLGLAPGATEDDVRNAHRMLMKKLHPDQGGSTYLASRVNQAKDVLLSRHR
jgi:hypothetical protein